MILEINSFERLQRLQEENDIPFAANITQVIVELVNGFAMQDEEEVYIYLNDSIVPESYLYNTCIWAQHFQDKISFDFVRSFRNRGEKRVCIYAGVRDFQPNFYRRLKERIAVSDVVSFPFSSVPIAYQKNPYTLVNRLRTININTAISIHHNKLIIRRIS